MYNLKNILLNCLCLVSLFSCNHKPENPEIISNANLYKGTNEEKVDYVNNLGIKTTITPYQDKSIDKSEDYLREMNNIHNNIGKNNIIFKD
jgi:hypothetical protein